MCEEVQVALAQLTTRLEAGDYREDQSLNFLETEELLEEDYRASEVEGFQQAFVTAARQYIATAYPDQFLVYCDWCVHVVPMALAQIALSPALVKQIQRQMAVAPSH